MQVSERGGRLEDAVPGPGAVARRARGGRTWVAVLLTLLVVGGGVGFMVVDSLQSARYYRTIPEVQREAASLQGKHFRVAGKVVPGSLSRIGEGALPAHRFMLDELGEQLVVLYDRALPDSFTEGVEVVVEGSLLPGGEFQASEVIARCPSKYEAEFTPESVAAAGRAPAGSTAPAVHPSDVPLGAGHPTDVPGGPVP